MALLTQRYAASFLGRRYRDRGPELRIAPETIVLPAREEDRPSPLPTVHIYAGTETAQFRAERVFVWSIAQVRDPARRYEIHLMKNLAGFHRRLWLTGFTNYRFAIPHLAGAEGKAIYNDVDQIYLADPAALFDLDMEGCGYRSISDQDTSVMLIDCARMASVWPLDDAMRKPRRALDAAARAVPGLWGPIDPGWNARDTEYAPETTRVLHFTGMRTQPWRPLPSEYVYAENPIGAVWFDLEHSADRAGFTVFTAERPSAGFRAVASRLAAAQASNRPRGDGLPWTRDERRRLATLLERHGAGDVVHTSLLGDPPPPLDDPSMLRPLETAAGPVPADVMIGTGVLEAMPDDDVAWMLDWLFGHARVGLFLRIDDAAETVAAPGGGRLPRVPRGADWWQMQLDAASARHPAVHWIASVRGKGILRPRHTWFEGGPRLGAAATAWVLASDKTGHTSQAIGIAEALGAAYSIRPVALTPGMLLSLIARRDLPRPGPGRPGLAPPWPDLVIASGWLPTRVARRIRAQSGGRAAIVLLGRKAGAVRDPSDIVVACRHFGLPAHPRRVETVLPPCQVSGQRLRDAAERWLSLMSGAPAPRVVLLVGGSSRSHRFEPDFARQIGYAVSQAVERLGGALFVVTSRRTGEEATKALRRALPVSAHLHAWRKGAQENPFFGYLAQADVLVVTGESESMLAEAVATGKPVYIVRVPEKPAGPWQRLGAWVARRGNTTPENYRGTVRPQQGLEYICARIIDRGIVLPPRDIDGLHRDLVAMGLARMFAEGNVAPFARPPYDPTREVAVRVRRLLGMDAAAAPTETPVAAAEPAAE